MLYNIKVSLYVYESDISYFIEDRRIRPDLTTGEPRALTPENISRIHENLTKLRSGHI